MSREEMLLTIFGEECSETAQRVSKALRFGLNEKEPGQNKTNLTRMMDEYFDIIAMMQILVENGIVPEFDMLGYKLINKRNKVEQYLAYSETLGTLKD